MSDQRGARRRARGFAIDARAWTMELTVAEHRAKRWPNGRPRADMRPLERLWALRNSVDHAWRKCAANALLWLLS